MSDHDREKDQLADALHALSEGDVPSESLADEEHVEELLGEIEHATAGPQVLDNGLVEVPPSDRIARPLRPPVPGARPIDVVAPQAPPPSPAVDRREPRQTTESAEPARERPAIPALSDPPPAAPPVAAPPAEFQHIVDDDLLEVPAPSLDMLAAARPATVRPRLPRSVAVQRTIIPVLLTIGLLLPAVALWLVRMPEDSQLQAIGQRTQLYLFAASPIFLGLALVNMLQVRSAIKRFKSAEDSVAAQAEPAIH